MGRRRTKNKEDFKDIYASVTPNRDRFGTLFERMLKSAKYQSLGIGARDFYTKCRVQSQSKIGRACLYKYNLEHGTTYNHDIYFVFPAEHLKAYGIDRRNANRLFKELEEAGFIECEAENKHRYKVNVYRFSSKWKNSS